MANQIFEMINNVATDVLGGQSFTRVVDVSTLITFGNELTDLNAKDLFYGKFHKQITKVLYKVTQIKRSASDRIMKTVVDFNSALMLVESNDLPSATNNNSIWTVQNDTMSAGGQKDPFGSDIDGEFDFDIQYFHQWATWSYEKMIPEYQHGGLFSANYEGFVNMIYTMLESALNNDLNNAERLVVATAIAQAKDSNNANCYKNVLAMYLDLHEDSELTAETCLYDADFLRYLAHVIDLDKTKIKAPSKLYSPTGKLRSIEDGELCIDMLADVSAKLDTYLGADVFHNELVGVDGYKVVPFWQGLGTGTFDELSRIGVVTPDGKGAGSQGADVQTVCEGVICAMYKDDKCMMTMDKERSHTIYNPRSEVIDLFNKIDIAYAINKNSPIIVYYIADVITTS